MSTENSTPSEAIAENTSGSELIDDVNTSPETELETISNEAENEDNIGESDEETPQTPVDESKEEKLLFGKFKTIEEAEKAYKEAEKAIKEKAEYEKQLQVYHDLESQKKLEAETLARQSGFGSVEEQKIAREVKNFEYQRYVEALDTGYAGERYNEAFEALNNYQQTLNPAYLTQAKQCFGADAVEIIASNTALYKAQKSNELNTIKSQQFQTEVRGKLENFAKETGDWLDKPERGQIVAQAINLAGKSIDLSQVKELVDALETQAIERYKSEQKAVAENQSQINRLEVPTGGGNTAQPRKVFTREEFNNLSDVEYEKNYELIAEQIELEKDGKLPRNLT